MTCGLASIHFSKKTLVWNLSQMERIYYFPWNMCQLQDLREDFLIFFFLHDVEQDILKILQEEKLANMDSIEFHKISHMTNE